MNWLEIEYNTILTFWHKLDDNKDVVDKSCLQIHCHEKCPIVVKIKVNENLFLDYKTMKFKVEKVLQPYNDNITQKFGLTTTESILKALYNDLQKAFENHTITCLYLRETGKYGVTLHADN